MGYRMTICSALLMQYQRVTDGRTDGRTDRQTDVQPIAKSCFSIADARKNEHFRSYISPIWGEKKP